jgi:hypothetical protein
MQENEFGKIERSFFTALSLFFLFFVCSLFVLCLFFVCSLLVLQNPLCRMILDLY